MVQGCGIGRDRRGRYDNSVAAPWPGIGDTQRYVRFKVKKYEKIAKISKIIRMAKLT